MLARRGRGVKYAARHVAPETVARGPPEKVARGRKWLVGRHRKRLGRGRAMWMQWLPERLPLELQLALGTEVTRCGFPPVRHPAQCGDALLALERHRKHELTCLLKIALMKLSPARGTNSRRKCGQSCTRW